MYYPVLEAGSPRSGCQHGQVLACRQLPSHCVLTWQREKDPSSSSFKTTNAIELEPTLMTLFTLQKPCLQMQSYIRVRALTHESGGHMIQSMQRDRVYMAQECTNRAEYEHLALEERSSKSKIKINGND